MVEAEQWRAVRCQAQAGSGVSERAHQVEVRPSLRGLIENEAVRACAVLEDQRCCTFPERQLGTGFCVRPEETERRGATAVELDDEPQAPPLVPESDTCYTVAQYDQHAPGIAVRDRKGQARRAALALSRREDDPSHPHGVP